MSNTDSILTSIKSMLGIQEDYTHFDNDIVTYINSVFLTLMQIGVGPAEGFMITDKTDEWTDYIEDGPLLNSVKSYVYLKVKLLFDPPLNTSTTESINRIIAEFEWRINHQVDVRKEADQNE